MHRKSWSRGWSNRCGRPGNFERGREFYGSGRLDGFWLGSSRKPRDGLLRGRGRNGDCETRFEFVDAGFEFVQVFEAGFKFVEGFDDAGETLVFLLTMEAGLHPAIEGPHGKDEDPELHGTSGRVCRPCC